MTEYTEEIGKCTQAKFVFTKQDSFTMYLEFEFGGHHITGFYISSYAEMEEIRKMLNKHKTGMSQDSIDNYDLDRLIGKTAKIQSAGLGSKCIYNGFVEKVIVYE